MDDMTARMCTKGEWRINFARVLIEVWKRISDKRTKNQVKTDKTGHGMEKSGKAKVKSKPKSTKVKAKKSTKSKTKSTVKVKAEAVTEEMLNGPTRTHLMGRVNPFIHHEDQEAF
ncbi:hypothetical protein Tco_1395562 [Tanacetum coccineum]